MRAIRIAALAVSALFLYGCETTRQQADIGFQPRKGNYRVIVMQPDVTAGLLTAGGIVEPREDWTNAARDNVVKAVEARETQRAAVVKIAATNQDTGWETGNATMTPQDLTSMVESAYRIRGGVKIFETTAVKPVTFLGQQGVQFDYTFVNEDSIKRRGRSVMVVAGGKLYVMSLNATALHYFDAALPDFDAMAASASIG